MKEKFAVKHLLIWTFVLTVFVTPLIGAMLFGNSVIVNIRFLPAAKEETGTEKVVVSDYNESLPISAEGFYYNSDKRRYECMVADAENGYLNVALTSLQSFNCTFKYRLTDENAEINDMDSVLVTTLNRGEVTGQEFFALSDFDLENNMEMKYHYDADGISVVVLHVSVFLALFVCLWFLSRLFKKNSVNPILGDVVEKILLSDYVCLAFFALAWFQIVLAGRPSYIMADDSSTYCIDSISELSWHHRMPLYQLFILGIRVLFRCENLNEALPYVVKAQALLTIVGILFFYSALKHIVKRKQISFVFSICYTLLIGIYGYAELIMTESLAAMMMCIMVWLIVQCIETEQRRYIILANILTVAATLTRPSFLFLYPIIAVFTVILFLCKRNRAFFIAGILSFVGSVMLILGYCQHNKALTGKFMLCDVSYHNQAAIVIAANIYDNPNYPEYTDFIEERVGKEPNLGLACKTCWDKGYSEAARYIADCKRLHRKEYIDYLISIVTRHLDQPIVILSPECVPGNFLSILFEMIRGLLMPFNYAGLLIITFGEIVYCAVCFVKRKEVLFMPIGITGCILSGYIVSVISWTSTQLQRYMVHLIPLYVMLVAIICMQLIQQSE